jgi:hypothetical protein
VTLFFIKACSALKYTIGFFLVFVVLLICGILMHAPQTDSTDPLVERLAGAFTVGESVLMFVVGSLTLLGLACFIVYGVNQDPYLC